MKKSMKKQEESAVMVVSSLGTYINKCLNDNGINFSEDTETSAFNFGIKGENVDVDFIVRFDDENSWIRVFAVLEYRSPKEKAVPLLRAMNRVNISRSAACLRLDEEDGTISASFMINTDGGITENDILLGAIAECYKILLDNFDDFMRVIYGSSSPEMVLKAAEELTGTGTDGNFN